MAQEIKRMPEIVFEGNLTRVTTLVGTFNMPRVLYDAYLVSFRPTQKSFGYNFAYELARATIQESSSSKFKSGVWYEEELDEKIRQLVAERGIEPREFLDKYHQRSERTSELWNVVTPEILDLVARNNIFYNFSRHTPIDRYTFIEHAVLAGSFHDFFGHPFMGGYSNDKDVQDQARMERKRQVLDHKSQLSRLGLMVYVNKDNWAFGGDVREYFRSGERVQKLDQARAGIFLGKILRGLKNAPKSLDEVDYVRIVLSPVQYDKDLVAVPKPVSLQFLRDAEVVCETGDRTVISAFRPKKNRIALTDAIEDDKGTTRHIVIKTKDGQHTLSEVSEQPHWFDIYYKELFG